MYELQLFDDNIGQYVPVETGDDPQSLMSMARGMARRVINAFRDKPLPLKPRVPYGLSGKPHKYRPDTMIEPADHATIAERAIRYYEKRAQNGEKNIPVYVWKGSRFESDMHILSARPEIFNIIRLDPEDYGV